VEIRPARPEDAPALHVLTLASKGSWGYPDDLMRALDASLDVAADLHRPGHTAVAERGGQLVGWAQVLAPCEGVTLLDHLWVAPGAMRSGVGSALFQHVARAAREMGATTMEWEADPNAVPFYERMGGRTVRTATSEWGRELDVMAVDVRQV
jgi:GNAT superfamily N-acetyltransferase